MYFSYVVLYIYIWQYIYGNINYIKNIYAFKIVLLNIYIIAFKYYVDNIWHNYQSQVNNMHYVPFEENIPDEENAEETRELLYYQWIPFILLFQALLFFLPSVLWHGLNQKV